jgi:hypothetical protein
MMSDVHDAFTSLAAHGKELPAGLTEQMKEAVDRLVSIVTHNTYSLLHNKQLTSIKIKGKLSCWADTADEGGSGQADGRLLSGFACVAVLQVLVLYTLYTCSAHILRLC